MSRFLHFFYKTLKAKRIYFSMMAIADDDTSLPLPMLCIVDSSFGNSGLNTFGMFFYKKQEQKVLVNIRQVNCFSG